MEKINNKPLKYYGLVLMNYEGILNMPSRLGDTFYDWGDYLQPLVNDEDIFWSAKDFVLNVFFDTRLTNKSLSEVINELKRLGEFNLNSKYGNYKVTIKEIRTQRYVSGNAKLNIYLNERLPKFTDKLKPAKSGKELSIDGYDLRSSFGFVVNSIKTLDYLPELKPLNITTFNTSSPFSDFRGFKTFEFQITKSFSDSSELTETTEQFKKILSKSNFRNVISQGKTYKCFLTNGFDVKINKNHASFNVKLNIDESLQK
ncbi:MAG: hypothetical protein KGV59_05395 [Tenacibaculum sp.]|nr:hypothetical protein [Tenacibaculum sp.]